MDQYFNDTILLENTLLPYFDNDEPLKLLNKVFSGLNYEKYNINLQPHGLLETYYIRTRKLINRKNYKNGILHGIYEEYYPDGKLDIRCWYKDGEKDNLYESWYYNGRYYQRCWYKNRKLDGIYKVYYDNGQICIETHYKNGKFHGRYKEFHLNGQLKIKTNYRNGKLHGLYKEWANNTSGYSEYNVYLYGISFFRIFCAICIMFSCILFIISQTR